MGGFYARDAASAETMLGHLVEAGLQVEPVAEIDLFDEGLSLVSRKAFRVTVAEADRERAAQVLEERAAELIDWMEDLSHLAPIPDRSDERSQAPAPAPPVDRRQAWESEPASWVDDLFSEQEGLSDSVLVWLEASPIPIAPDVGKALARAIRENREDLIWPLCRLLKSVIEDAVLRPVQALLYVPPQPRAPGVYSAIDDLVELAWDPSAFVRRNFCLAAGQISSEPLLAPVVSLLDDPEEEVRYEASGALYGMVHKDFGYDSEAPAEERALAVARWKEWLAARYGGTSWSS